MGAFKTLDRLAIWPAKWSQTAREVLSGCGTAADLDDIQQECESGESQLWRVAGCSSGYLVTRLEVTPTGRREFVLVMGAGENARPVIKWAERLAHQLDCDALRTHIRRPGLERIYEAAGWKRDHIIMKRELRNGQ